MALPQTEDILAVASENVASFIQDQTSSKTFSSLMRRLNEDLLNGDAEARDRAARALQHLGFPEYA